jgi:hypothetical protein
VSLCFYLTHLSDIIRYQNNTQVPFQVWHKLNYFLICQEKFILIVNYDEKNLNPSSQQSLIPEPSLQLAYSTKLLTTSPQKQ